jgi:hypothetical protein
MPAITINRLQTQLRLPPQAMRERARLQRAITSALDQTLEPALERKGISPHGYLCIRRLHVAVRLGLGQPDSALADAVAEAIADGIVDAQSSESSIYYSSRTHALVDLASAAMRADLTRSWAWVQLGLWSDEAADSGAAAGGWVMRALAREARHAIPALACVSQDGSTLCALLRWGAPSDWLKLAANVCKEYGATVDWAQPGRAKPLREAGDEMAVQIVRKSSIAGAMAERTIESLPDAVFGALTLLIVLEAEPAALRFDGPAAQALLDSVRLRLASGLTAEKAEALPEAEPYSKSEGRFEHERYLDSSRDAGHDEYADHDGHSQRGQPSTRWGGSEYGERARSHDGRLPRFGFESLRGQANGNEAGAAEAPLCQLRQSRETSAGGLVYLLSLAARIELPARIVEDLRLRSRGLRWTLHQLALSLLPLLPDTRRRLPSLDFFRIVGPTFSTRPSPTKMSRWLSMVTAQHW